MVFHDVPQDNTEYETYGRSGQDTVASCNNDVPADVNCFSLREGVRKDRSRWVQDVVKIPDA